MFYKKHGKHQQNLYVEKSEVFTAMCLLL